MKLFKSFSKRSKAVIGSVLAIVAATLLVVPQGTQAAIGANRETKSYVQGMKGFDHVQFNSFTNVPGIGDERNFFTGMMDGAAGNFYDPMNNVKAGDTLLVRVYIHNNADDSLNASGQGVAKNTKVRVALPTAMSQTQSASAFISADNAQPQIIEDTLSITAPSAVNLEYVPGSARIKSFKGNLSAPLSDEIVKGGVTIGSESLNGDFKGCFDHQASVVLKVKVTAPQYVVQKTVRAHGAPTFAEEATVKPGDTVDFSIGFQNSGSTTLNDVIVGDRLPVGLSYIPGSTEWNSTYTNKTWTKVPNDNWMNGGLNFHDYGPNGFFLIRFSAKVADASALECGTNQIINHAFAKPKDHVTIQDSATVKVNKACQTDTPIYACTVLTVEKGTDRSVTVKDFQQTAKDGAVFKHVVIDWNDGTTTMTDAANGQPHQYAKDGTYVIRAVPYFTVPGSTTPVAAPENAACSQTVTFSTAVTTPPAVLPSAGAGSIAAMFAAVSVAGAFAHRLFLGRRMVS